MDTNADQLWLSVGKALHMSLFVSNLTAFTTQLII